ncbi:MAG: NAD(P)/FAD-dependent oxidoreductase [Gammaproteobacteria bacterium]|nr:NAD(P)/FAD-dependent oxidoreductase [Gammaproteobacteria bacterium]
MDCVENLIVGAGPAGLRAAQVLAEAGREAVVLEKNSQVGPKTCGGGLSVKAVRELRALGLPADAGLTSVAHASFRGEPAAALDPEHARIVTLSRERLGRYQAEWAAAAGADVRIGTAVTRIDFAGRTVSYDGGALRYRNLIGADGSGSMVRRALGLDTPRAFFAGEYNVPGRRELPLHIAFQSDVLASGYFWVFPHETHVCIGAGAHKRKVRPSSIRPFIERRMAELGIDPGGTPYEGATVEVDFRGFHFPGGVHLVGDAAGTPSGLTAEGIYAALVTGEEVARCILEPGFPMPKTRHWLRVKRSHDRVGRVWLRRAPRELSLAAMPALCRRDPSRRWISAYFLET